MIDGVCDSLLWRKIIFTLGERCFGLKTRFSSIAQLKSDVLKGKPVNQLKCPSCGSNDLVEDGRYYICQYCGGRIERDLDKIPSHVSSSTSVERIIERADMYWDVGKRDRARQLYRQALDIDATNEKARTRAR